jgi:hypothetical protein
MRLLISVHTVDLHGASGVNELAWGLRYQEY